MIESGPTQDTDGGVMSPLPSYEALREAGQGTHLNPDVYLLFWSLNGPLSVAIRVMDDCFYDPDSVPESYVLPAPDANGSTLHPISQSSLTAAKISSVTVKISPLDDWENTWLDLHRNHSEPGDNESDDTHWGQLPDYDSDDDETDFGEFLLKCCGMERPRPNTAGLLVQASGDFVTVHDYVSALHPWIMGKRDDILGAIGALNEEPLPAETPLMVFPGLHSVLVTDQKEWRSMKRRKGTYTGNLTRMISIGVDNKIHTWDSTSDTP